MIRINNITLYFDIITRKGALERIPVNIAPAPKKTNKEGSAQHNKVLILVNKDNEGSTRFRVDIGFIINFKMVSSKYNSITPTSTKRQ